jgi:hypothetical protein
MLVDFSVKAAAEDPQASWLRDIFAKGFRGFAGMSSAELLRELQFRDLAAFDDADDVEESDDEDEETRVESLIGRDRSERSEAAGTD